MDWTPPDPAHVVDLQERAVAIVSALFSGDQRGAVEMLPSPDNPDDLENALMSVGRIAGALLRSLTNWDPDQGAVIIRQLAGIAGPSGYGL